MEEDYFFWLWYVLPAADAVLPQPTRERVDTSEMRLGKIVDWIRFWGGLLKEQPYYESFKVSSLDMNALTKGPGRVELSSRRRSGRDLRAVSTSCSCQKC